MSISDYLIEKVLNHFTKTGDPYGTPPNLHMALTSQGTELDGDGYARAPIKFDTAKSLNDGTSEVKNLEEVLFTTATDTWYADGFAIYDALTSGNRMFDGEFAESVEVTSSQPLAIKKDYLRLSLGLDHWTTDGQERALNLAFAGGSYQPSGLYVALLESEPNFSETSSELDELSGGGYSRVQVVGTWSQAGHSAWSDDEATFAAATADWDQFVASAFVDAQQDGVVIGWSTNDAIEVLNGDVVEIPASFAAFNF